MAVIVAGPVLLSIPLEEPVLRTFLACPPTTCTLTPTVPGAALYALTSDFSHWSIGQAVRITFADHTHQDTRIAGYHPLPDGGRHYCLTVAPREER